MQYDWFDEYASFEDCVYFYDCYKQLSYGWFSEYILSVAIWFYRFMVLWVH
jgi:hypothetical protein